MEFTKIRTSQNFYFMHSHWEILSQMISFTELKGERRLKKYLSVSVLFSINASKWKFKLVNGKY